MRLISADSYSYGEKGYAWNGLIDPKLFQRYTYLLPEVIFNPAVIPTKSVSTLRASVSVASPTVGVSIPKASAGVNVGLPIFGVSIKKTSTSVSV